PGEYVVKLRPTLNANSSDKAHLSSVLGSFVKSTIPEQNIVVVKRPVFELKSHAVKTLAENPYVQIAEPNYIYRINRMPNDPDMHQLWSLINTGANNAIAGIDIGAEQA